MDRTDIKKIIENTIKKVDDFAEKRYSEEFNKFLKSREGYVDKIVELDQEYGMYSIRDAFIENIGIDPIELYESHSNFDCIEFDPEKEESVKKWLEQKKDGNLDFEKLKTVLVWCIKDTINSEYNKKDPKEVERKSFEKILKEVIEDEEYIKVHQIRNNIEKTIEDPLLLINQIKDNMKLENGEVKIDLSENDMKNLQKNYQKSNNEENKNKWFDLIAMKVQLGTLKPEDVSKELLDEVKNLNENNIKDKEYEETFNSVFQGALENYAKNIKPENFDEKTMQTLYENNYKGEFSTPLIEQFYTRYCNEQEQNKKIDNKDKVINEKKEDIKSKDETITNQSDEIENKNKTIEEQNKDIKNKDQIIEKKDKQIKNQENIIEEQKKQLEQVEHQKSDADKEIERLKKEVEDLKIKNQSQKTQIDGLVQRTKFLEDVVNRQQKYINSIMENIKYIKNSINDLVNNLKPKNLKERIIAKFIKEKDSVMNQQKNEIEELIGDVEKESTKFYMLQSGGVDSTEEYLQDYTQEQQFNRNKNSRENDYVK